MKILVAVVMIGLLSVSLAVAQQDVVGKIKSVDSSAKTVMLEDGTKLVIPEGSQVAITELKPGQSVKVSYEEKNGQKTVKSISIEP
jgi:hypothetical protein